MAAAACRGVRGQGGRFLAVGSSADIRKPRGRRTPMFDAQQMTIVPGFIDCHNHGARRDAALRGAGGGPFEVKFVTIDSIIDKLRKKRGRDAAGLPGWRAISSMTPRSPTSGS